MTVPRARWRVSRFDRGPLGVCDDHLPHACRELQLAVHVSTELTVEPQPLGVSAPCQYHHHRTTEEAAR